MRKKGLCFCFLLVSAGIAFAQFSDQQRFVAATDENRVASTGESEILIRCTRELSAVINKQSVSYAVYLNGSLVAQVLPNRQEKIIVKNGTHAIEVVAFEYGKKGWTEHKSLMIISSKAKISCNSNSNINTIVISENKIGTINPKLTIIDTAPLKNQEPQVRRLMPGIEGAIKRVSEVLIDEVPSNSIVAVVNVSSLDRGIASFVMDELEFLLVDSKRFKIVDRKTLDSIRDEQNFQASGEVSDASAVSIGDMLGANIVITGSIAIYGSTQQRLTLKALDVQTAEIVSMGREQF
ncbi:MAG: CsgG/HfaB family protein [Treponema sp.]|nr:CsgG/HfaB family protein [Treponema sp.]